MHMFSHCVLADIIEMQIDSWKYAQHTNFCIWDVLKGIQLAERTA